MKNMKEKVKETISKKAGELAIKVGGYEGGSAYLFIDDTKMPKELIKKQINNNDII